ncbi:MAG: cell division protein FtsA [Spirochaetes bacterium]|nr:MAG: cell division protein FtsA [Spirochaetota bacterium]
MTDSEVIAGLDIGTNRIRVLVAEYDTRGKLVVSGWGESRSEGMRKGIVVNIEAAREAVLKAVEAAEHEAGRTVTELWTALGGASVDSLNSRGVVAVSGKNREIGEADVERVLDAARAVVIPMDRDILHVLPQEYIIDDQGGVRNPMDMIGVRLEAEVHIVTASVSAIKNIEKAIERADYKLGDVALGSLAAARALLNEDEKEMGVLMIDIGASSTDFILVHGGAPRVTGSVPVGGAQASSDLSIVLNTPLDSAERIKCESGCCWDALADAEEPVIIPGVGGRPPVPVPVTELCRILQPRMEEIFRIVRKKIEKTSGNAGISGGVVLTGGGALLPGVADVASGVFNQPVRLGNPRSSVEWPESCRDSRWSTAAGLILLGDAVKSGGNNGENTDYAEESVNPLKGLMKWLGEFF